MPQLLINEAGNLRVEVVEKDDIYIGKSKETDITIEQESISPFHCQIKKIGSQYRIIDLNTATGTYVNGIHIQEHVLRTEDMIQIGEVFIVFHEDKKPARDTSHLRLREDEDYSLDLGWEEEDVAMGTTGFFDFTALQRDQIRNFLNLNMPINTAPDLNILLDRLIDSALDLTTATSGMILVRDKRFRLSPVCHRNLPRESYREATKLILQPVSRKVVEVRSYVNITDIERSPFFDLKGKTFPEYQSVLGIPLRTMTKQHVMRKDLAHLHPANRTLGVLLLMRHKGKSPFQDQEIPMIEAVSHQIAVSIFNLKLHLMASADPLTGLYNRNYFQTNLAEEMEYARAGKGHLAVAIMDIDHFKKFNENYGARAGDRILTSLGRITLSHIREIDVVARYGGEKFIFLFLHMDAKGAYGIMERLRKTIESFSFLEDGHKITVSIGIAEFPKSGSSPDQIIEMADKALFRAKQLGRNRTVIAERERDRTGGRTDKLAGIVSGNLAKDYQHMQVLMETIQVANSTLDPQDQIVQLLDKVVELTNFERAIILEPQAEGKFSVGLARDRKGHSLEAVWDFSPEIPQLALDMCSSLHEIWDPAQDPPDFYPEDRPLSKRLVLCAPLREKEKDLGILYLDSGDLQHQIQETDLTFFDAMAKQIAMALNQSLLFKQLQDKERIQHEFNIAASIQSDLLPKDFPDIPYADIAGNMIPAKEIGGDYYDVISTFYEEPPRYFLCIGDVSGKGLPAGLVMVMARSAIRPLIQTGSVLSPAEILYHLNQMIYQNTSGDTFMSMLLFELLEEGLHYASAGHEHILLYRHAQQKAEAIPSGGVVLGLSPHVPMYENKFLPLKPNDVVVLYTDGATEARNRDEEEFQLERMLRLVEEQGKAQLSAKEIVDNCFLKLKEFIQGCEQLDDITFVVAKCTRKASEQT